MASLQHGASVCMTTVHDLDWSGTRGIRPPHVVQFREAVRHLPWAPPTDAAPNAGPGAAERRGGDLHGGGGLLGGETGGWEAGGGGGEDRGARVSGRVGSDTHKPRQQSKGGCGRAAQQQRACGAAAAAVPAG